MSTSRITFAILSLVCTSAFAQTSFWADSAAPDLREVTSTESVTLGLRFHSDVPGYLTGIQFYKGTNNTGTHTGALWSNTGARLATVTFSNETSSGWQQASFSSPVSIAANTTYVVSYTAPNGHHAHDQSYSWSNLTSAPLHVEGCRRVCLPTAMAFFFRPVHGITAIIGLMLFSLPKQRRHYRSGRTLLLPV